MIQTYGHQPPTFGRLTPQAFSRRARLATSQVASKATANRQEKMRTFKHILAFTLSVLAGVIVFNGFDFPEDYVQFKGPDGRRHRMSLRSEDLRSNDSINAISEIGVSLSSDK